MFAKILFWLLMILWLISGIYWLDASMKGIIPNLIPWLCIALLGFLVTGNPFRDTKRQQ